MWDFLSKLFDTSDFNPRWNCGTWTEGHGWLHIISDLGVWSAYLAIPGVLTYFITRRKDLPFPAIMWLFVAFILACGTTHLMEAIIFWWPAYRLAGVIKLLTALVSWATIGGLIYIAPKVLTLTSPQELEVRVQERTGALFDANAALENEMHERLRTEASLREQQQWFAGALSSIGDGLIATDAQGRVTFLNAVASRLTGVTPEHGMQRPLAEVLRLSDSESAEPVELPLQSLLGSDKQEPLRLEADLTGFEGTLSPVELAATPIRSGEKTLGIVLVLYDLTAHRAREAEQQEINDRIRSVVDHVVDGIITIDEEGSITSFNPAAERIFGITSEEMLGQNIRKLMPEPYREQHDSYLNNYLTTGEAKVIGVGREVIGRRQDGKTFPLDLAVSEFRLNQRRYFTGIVRDITERKRAEETTQFLADAGDVLATLVDFSSAVEKVARLSAPFLGDWCIVDLVREDDSFYRACVAHSRPDQESLMQTLRNRGELDLNSGALSAQVVRERTARLIPDAGDNAAALLEVTDAPGLAVLKSLQPRSILSVPLLVRNRPLGAITLIRGENSERYTAAELSLAEDLAHRAAIAVDNARLFQKVCETDRRKDEFLATIAHELRNPLAPIRHALEVMRITGSQAEQPRQAREMIQRQIDRLVRLVDDLLDVSRIMRGKIDLRLERLSLRTIVERALETSRPAIDAQEHELEVQLPEEDIWLNADETRLDQVISNLLNNAAKYTDAGGQIKLLAESSDSQAVIRVVDNGIGIERALLSEVFDLFRQADSSFSRSRGGLGIGLTLVRSLVELHGGTVEARSPGLGQGSEFIVRLPLAAPPKKLGISPTSGQETARNEPARRILVVDDNVDAADMLATLLRLEGHEVKTAYDGHAAVSTALEYVPDFVLLDIGMPGMNGYEVAARLRQEPQFQSVVLVAMTGFGQDQDRRRSQDAGINHHLVKPVAPDSIRSLLAEPT